MEKQKQILAAIGMVKAVADTIKEVKRIPSGHLYAQLMGVLALEDYDYIIGVLINAKLVTKTNHELIWNLKEKD